MFEEQDQDFVYACREIARGFRSRAQAFGQTGIGVTRPVAKLMNPP
jgi:hypothetical protein